MNQEDLDLINKCLDMLVELGDKMENRAVFVTTLEYLEDAQHYLSRLQKRLYSHHTKSGVVYLYSESVSLFT